MSTLKTSCYTDYTPTQEAVDFFQTVVDLFKTLDTYSVRSSPLLLMMLKGGGYICWLNLIFKPVPRSSRHHPLKFQNLYVKCNPRSSKSWLWRNGCYSMRWQRVKCCILFLRCHRECSRWDFCAYYARYVLPFFPNS